MKITVQKYKKVKETFFILVQMNVINFNTNYALGLNKTKMRLSLTSN